LKIKILFVLSTLTGGGAERVALNIMSALDKRKFDIHLVLLQNYGEYLKQIPEEIHTYILDVKRTLSSPLALRKCIVEIKPDILYATLFHTIIATHIATIGIKDRPKIIFRNPTSPKRAIEEGEISLFYRILIRYVYNRAYVVLAQTPEMKTEITDYFKVNSDIKVFINPLDIDNIKHSILNVENVFNNAKINVVAAGRLSYEKGFDILLQAFEKVIESDDRYYLHIIGKDEGEQQNLMALISDLDLSKYVKLWGFQQNPYQFFKYSNLYVLPSRIEGLPNTVLENLYLGIPVVATNCIPFMHTLIDDGNNGFIVDVENIEQLAQAILNHTTLSLEDYELKLDFGNPDELFLNIHNG